MYIRFLFFSEVGNMGAPLNFGTFCLSQFRLESSPAAAESSVAAAVRRMDAAVAHRTPCKSPKSCVSCMQIGRATFPYKQKTQHAHTYIYTHCHIYIYIYNIIWGYGFCSVSMLGPQIPI